MKPDLKADALPQFVKQQAGDVQGFRHLLKMHRRRQRVVLPHIHRAEKRRVGKSNHPSSPSNSAARISATSLAEKNTVAPRLFQPRTLVVLATMPAAVMVQEAVAIGMMAKKMLISKGRSRSR